MQLVLRNRVISKRKSKANSPRPLACCDLYFVFAFLSVSAHRSLLIVYENISIYFNISCSISLPVLLINPPMHHIMFYDAHHQPKRKYSSAKFNRQLRSLRSANKKIITIEFQTLSLGSCQCSRCVQ